MLPKMIQFNQVTPEMLAQELQFTKNQLAVALNLLKDVAFGIDTPEDFETKYSADIAAIETALKQDPRALADPAHLLEVPQRSKILYSVISLLTPLLPPDPGKVQIIKPN